MQITGLDETDNHILKSLAQNARKSYSNIDEMSPDGMLCGNSSGGWRRNRE